MIKEVIAIIGGAGNVGNGAVTYLLKNTDFQIVVGYFSKKPHIPQIYKERVKLKKVNVYDNKELCAFCEDVSVIVNCAGPSSEIQERIVQRCIEKDLPYVDVAGDDKLFAGIKSLLYENQKSITCVLGAGVYPGLTECMIGYAKAVFGEKIEELKIFFGGNGVFSKNAIMDILNSIYSDVSFSRCYVKNGKCEKICGNPISRWKSERSGKEFIGIPIVSEKFLKMSIKEKIPKVYFYNSYKDEIMLKEILCLYAKYSQIKGDKKAEGNVIQELYDLYINEQEKDQCYTILKAIINEQKSIELVFNEDWNFLSGKVAGVIAQSILLGTYEKRCAFLQDVVNVEDLFSKVTK